VRRAAEVDGAGQAEGVDAGAARPALAGAAGEAKGAVVRRGGDAFLVAIDVGDGDAAGGSPLGLQHFAQSAVGRHAEGGDDFAADHFGNRFGVAVRQNPPGIQ